MLMFFAYAQGTALMTLAAGIMRRLERRLCSEAPPCQSGVAKLLKALLDSVKLAGSSSSPPGTAASTQQIQPSR